MPNTAEDGPVGVGGPRHRGTGSAKGRCSSTRRAAVALLLACSLGLVMAAPTSATVNSVSIPSPTTAAPSKMRAGTEVDVVFNLTRTGSAGEYVDYIIEIYQRSAIISSWNGTMPLDSGDTLVSPMIIRAGAAEGSYTVWVAVRHPIGTGS